MYCLPAPVFFSLLVLTFLVYLPGLDGPFLFDDFGSVAALDKYGGIYDWESFRLFVFGDHTGPLGRPISQLSFLLDGASFADPWRFKYTNLMLHLLNGVMLCWLYLILESVRTNGQHRQRIAWVAVLAAGAWLLHPFNVSTTLYVVQRMTQLSSLFVLAGLVGYCFGRRLLGTVPWQGYFVMSISIVAGTGLAVLSKENGCLLPLFILVLESTVLSGVGEPPARRWYGLFLVAPVVLIIAYFVYYIVSGRLVDAYELRIFTLMERLLTEARVLWDYLGSWFFPAGMPRGLYADDYPLSTGLFSPPGTLIAILGIILLLVVAASRKVWSPLRLAILFFLAGHLIESTIFPLELYFEHRNYLPVMFLFYPVILFLETVLQAKGLRYLVGVLLICIPAVVTAQRASLWGDEYALTMMTVERYPYSERAHRVLALILERKGYRELALQELLRAEDILSDSMPIKMNIFIQSCLHGLDARERFSELGALFKNVSYKTIEYELLKSVVMVVHDQGCVNLGRERAHVFLDNFSLNPGIRERNGPKRVISHLRGVLYAEERKGALALDAFIRAQSYYPDVDAGLLEVAILATNDQYAEAQALLERVESISQAKNAILSGRGTLDYPKEIARLRGIIRNDIEQTQFK
ncbi:MAG: hypothetical protein A2W28_03055 [Gammaproteobacteria bacterium RBG_16_51_14]|nr:MAG: hypothetical protein A2W28_03055 [Gammaproteobacteria bacterium RBG_16_51_14]